MKFRERQKHSLAIPKHMLGKSGLPTFMEPVNAEEVFPVLSFKDSFNRFLAEKIHRGKKNEA